MIPNRFPATNSPPLATKAPPGMSQLEPRDTYEPGRLGAPDFISLFREALARRDAERAMAQQIQEVLTGGGR